ncbi:hypothetical protein HF325_003368 [Metschnikowia pulcherrima]|uniref:Altered inheritance of mitochondria protein 21 n=1 Tax=Metschnikowia pulcherrima TaxID=27326 RepID=A0A8H7GSB9_9ASCO|nr:hypothetical protein HF325_003368 [Metschnikowia pulcherrima]
MRARTQHKPLTSRSKSPFRTESHEPNEIVPELSGSGSPPEHQVINSGDEDSADVLLELVSELNKESPTAESHIYDNEVIGSGEEKTTHEPYAEINSTSPAEADLDNVTSTTEPITQTAQDQGSVESVIDAPSEQSGTKDDTSDSSVSESDDTAPENTPDISGHGNTPAIPSRPRRIGAVGKNLAETEGDDVSTEECKKMVAQLSGPEANTEGALETSAKVSLPLGYEQAPETDTPGHVINDDKEGSLSFVAKNLGEGQHSSESTFDVSKSETKPIEESLEPQSATESSPAAAVKAEDSHTADAQPIIPKRPTRSSTPKIPSRPVKQDRATSTRDLDKEHAKPEASDCTTAKKGPPPKPKKLSSKIAAFQQMFNQAPLEHTMPKPAPAERNKLSSHQTDFASNLQNMMGRGLPLPGMVNPDMVKKLSPSEHSEKDEANENEESAANSSIPRRARGPRGKRLPRLIQEAKIEVEPRFLVSVSEVWLVSLSKPKRENLEVGDSQEADIGVMGDEDEAPFSELNVPDGGAEEKGENQSQDQIDDPKNTSSSFLTEESDPVVSTIGLGPNETGNLDANETNVMDEEINSQCLNPEQSETNPGEGDVHGLKDSTLSFVASSESDQDDHPEPNDEVHMKEADMEAYEGDAILAHDEVLVTSADAKADAFTVEDSQ